jgi:hypothetical protein
VADYNLVQCVFDRELVSPDEDVAVITMHIRQVVAAAPDILPMTDEGRQDFVSRLGSWWTQQRILISGYVQLREARFYDVPSQPGQDMGDPVLVHPFGLMGTSTGKVLPPQVSVSVTFKTDKRRTWGRFYLPGVTDTYLGPKGRLDPDICPQIASWTHALTSRSGTGACLTIFSRKEWTHHDPQQIQVDDIYDIIRRRRFSSPTVRANVSAG